MQTSLTDRKKTIFGKDMHLQLLDMPPQAVLLAVEEKVLMYIIVMPVLADVWTAESLDPNADS